MFERQRKRIAAETHTHTQHLRTQMALVDYYSTSEHRVESFKEIWRYCPRRPGLDPEAESDEEEGEEDGGCVCACVCV